MLKIAIAAAAFLAVSAVAHADDSAFPRIEVKKIDPGPMVADGKVISFSGKNAADFFKMLPATISVDPKSDRQNARQNRNLTIMNNESSLMISCSKVIYDKNDNAHPNPEGTECKITLFNTNEDIEGDSFDYKPIVDGAAHRPKL